MYSYPTQPDPMAMISQQIANLENGYRQQRERLLNMQQQYNNNYQQQTQPPQTQAQPNAIPCMPVSSIDEVKAHRVDPMGGAAVFYSSGLNTFFTKYIDNSGLAKIDAYALVPPAETREPAFVERSEFNNIFNNLQSEIMQLKEALTSATTTTSAQYVATNPAIDANTEPNAVYPTTNGIDTAIPEDGTNAKRKITTRARNDSAQSSAIDGY